MCCFVLLYRYWGIVTVPRSIPYGSRPGVAGSSPCTLTTSLAIPVPSSSSSNGCQIWYKNSLWLVTKNQKNRQINDGQMIDNMEVDGSNPMEPGNIARLQGGDLAKLLKCFKVVCACTPLVFLCTRMCTRMCKNKPRACIQALRSSMDSYSVYYSLVWVCVCGRIEANILI